MQQCRKYSRKITSANKLASRIFVHVFGLNSSSGLLRLKLLVARGVFCFQPALKSLVLVSLSLRFLPRLKAKSTRLKSRIRFVRVLTTIAASR